MLHAQFACWSKQVPWTSLSSQQGSCAALHHVKPWESRTQDSQWLSKVRDPLEHDACSKSHQDSSPGQLPQHQGTTMRNPSICTQPTAIPATQAGGWCAPASELLLEPWGLKERNGSLWQSRDPFLWGQDYGLSLCVDLCSSPLPHLFFFF